MSKKTTRKINAARQRKLKDRLTEQELINSRLRELGVDMSHKANYLIQFWKERAAAWKASAKRRFQENK